MLRTLIQSKMSMEAVGENEQKKLKEENRKR